MHIHRQRSAILRLGLTVLLGALSLTGPVRATTSDTGTEPPHIRNAGAPPGGTSRLELTELWRAGGEDDEDTVFGLITQVRADADGNVYLLDTQLAHVEVFSADGEHLRTLGREGEGPGEIRLPVDMFLLPDGRVGLVQSFPGKIVLLAADGTPAGGITPQPADAVAGGFLSLTDAAAARDRFVLGGVRIGMQDNAQVRTSFLAACDSTGRMDVTYRESAYTLDFANLTIDEEGMWFPLYRHMAMGPDGRVYVPADRNRYAVTVYAPSGEVERVFERDVPPVRRTAEDRAKIEALLDAQLRNVPPGMKVTRRLSDYEPMINSLAFDGRDRLWIQATPGSRNLPDGVMAVYDLFSPAGKCLQPIELPPVGDVEHDGVFFAGRDLLVLVTGFVDAARQLQAGGALPEDEEAEAEPMAVICYRYREP